MRMEVGRYSIHILPENEIELAYIERVLGLQEADDFVKLKRVNVLGLSKLAYLSASREE